MSATATQAENSQADSTEATPPETVNGDATSERVLDAVMQRGIGVILDLHEWTGTVQLSPKDLKLEEETIPKRLMSLGRKRIIPKEWLGPPKNFQSAARKNLEAVSTSLLYSKIRFVPNEKLDGALAMLRKLQSDHYKAVANLCDNYEQAKKQAREEWEESLREDLNMDDKQVEEALARLDGCYPTVDQVRQSFVFEWTLIEIRMPRGIQARITEIRKRELAEEQVAAYVKVAIGELRSAVGELAKRVHESLTKKESLPQRSIDSIKREIERVRSLNWMEDGGTDDLLKRIEDGLEDDFMSGGDLADLSKKIMDTAAENIDEAAKDAIKGMMTGKTRVMEV